MKKRFVAALLSIALVLTDSSIAFAVRTANVRTAGTWYEASAAEQTQSEYEQEKQEALVEQETEKTAEAVGLAAGQAETAGVSSEASQAEDDQEQIIEMRSVQGDFEYTVSDGAAAITKYTGAGGSVVIPGTLDGVPVTSVGQKAFQNCTGLEAVEIPDTVTRIEAEAFENASSLARVDLPSGLLYMGRGAFRNCTSLTSIEIPASLERTVDEYDYSGPFRGSGLKEVAFEEGTTRIAQRLFRNCDSLEHIEIPDSVTEIGLEAFEYCTSLETVRIPDSVTVLGEAAFRNCAALISVDFGSGLKTIEKVAFRNCTALESVDLPDGITRIEAETFENASSLARVDLPSGLLYMGRGAFRNCTSLTSIEIPASLERTVDEYDYSGPFRGSGLKEVAFEEGTTRIAQRLFRNCDSLEHIEIPDSVTEIGQEAFEYCTSMKTVRIPDGVTVLGEAAFRNCTALISVDFGSGLKTIERAAFWRCTALESVDLPDTVTYIGQEAFEEDSSLAEADLPAGLTELGQEAFRNCTSLTSIEIPASLEQMGSDPVVCGPFEGSGLKKVVFEEGSTRIVRWLLRNCRQLTQVQIPDSMTEIEHTAFEYCTSLETIRIPDNVTVIGEAAFRNCTALAAVDFGQKLETIGDEAFRNCTALREADIPDSVTLISEEAFDGASALEQLHLPSGLTYLGSAAFRNCESLTAVEIPASLERTSERPPIYISPFTGAGIKDVTFEEGTVRIASNLFRGCDWLREIRIPDSVTTICEGAFRECVNLKTVELGAKTESIEKEAFYGCTALPRFYVPDTVTEIGERAFYGCTNLNDFEMGAGAEEFGWAAFDQCPAIRFFMQYGTPGHIYAIQNRIPVSLTTYAYTDFSDLAVQDGGTYSADYSALNTSGYVRIDLHYELSEEKFEHSGSQYVRFYFPEEAELVQEAVQVNGMITQDYTLEDGILSIPVKAVSGDISYGFIPLDVEDLTTAACYTYWTDGATVTEVLGYDNSSRPLLSVNCDELVTSSELTVSGLGAKSAEIQLYINQVPVGTVRTSKTGTYRTTVTVPDPQNGSRYLLEARNPADQTQTARTVFQYDDAAPRLAEFKMYYNNHQDSVFDLLNAQTKPSITFNPGIPLTFTTEFENPESIGEVYIVSTRNNERRLLEAEYDPSSGKYIASGFFDESNPLFVPGTLTVEYTRVQEEVKVGQEVDWDAMYQALPEEIKRTTVTTVTENGQQRFRFDFSDVSEKLKETKIDLILSSIDEAAGTELSDWRTLWKALRELGEYTIPGLDDEAYTSVGASGVLEYVFMAAKEGADLTDGAVQTRILLQGDSEWTGWNEVAQQLELISSGISVASDLYGFAQDRDQLIQEIYQTPDIKNKNEAVQKANELFDDQMAYTLLMAMLPVLVKTVGVSTGPAGIVFTALLGVIGALSGMFWDYRVNMIKSEEVSIRWAIDPSGFVYEAVEDNRLSGVKVTAYYKENLEDTQAILWDASEYEQENPLYTDAEGRYAWDVPEGYWQVKYEKEGYETVYSDWLPVPPPQTEVNVGLVSKEKPVLEWAVVYADHARLMFSKYMQPDTVASLVLKDENGNPVPYTLEYDTDSVSPEGVNYAKEYTLRFGGDTVLALGSSCVLESDGTEKSYAGTAMDRVQIRTEVRRNVEIVAPDSVTVAMGETAEIPVFIVGEELNDRLEAAAEAEALASVAGVTGNGVLVTGHLYGQTQIVVSIPGTGVTKTILVTVGEKTEIPDAAPSVLLSQAVYMLEEGTALTIVPEVYPSDSAGVSWSIMSGAEVVQVEDGTVTALRAGEAVLRCALADNRDVYAECRIIVRSSGDPQPAELPYGDVREDDWFYEDVLYAYVHKLMTGYGDGSLFGPYNNLARAEFAQILYRLEGQPDTAARSQFPDVKESDWYRDAVVWAYDAGIVTGYSNGYFGPADKINREQLAVMMYRYAVKKGYDVTASADFSQYLDAASVSEFAVKEMKWAVAEGIISGKYGQTRLDPQGNASRAECAIILTRFMKAYVE